MGDRGLRFRRHDIERSSFDIEYFLSFKNLRKVIKREDESIDLSGVPEEYYTQVVLALLEKEPFYAKVVLEHPKVFKDFVPDETLALDMIEKGEYYAEIVIDNAEVFDGFKPNKILALHMIEKDICISVLIDSLKSFKDLDGEVALILIKKGYKKEVKNNLEIFSITEEDEHRGELRDFVNREIQEQDIELYTQEWQFERLLSIHKIEPTFLKKHTEHVVTNAQDILRQCIADRNKHILEEYIHVLEIVEYDIPDDIQSDIDTFLENYEEPEYKERERYKEIDLIDEIIEFYVYEAMQQEIDALGQRLTIQTSEEGKTPREEQEFSFRDKVRLFDIKNKKEKHTEHMFQWMREMIIVTVNGELSLANNTNLYMPKSQLDPFIRYATAEEIRIYMHRAEKRFMQPVWSETALGGKKWEHIAQTGYAIWQDENKIQEQKLWGGKVGLIDHIIDLQHNGGSVFDKDFRRIIDNYFILLSILDKKRDSKDVDSLWEDLKSHIQDGDVRRRIEGDIEFIHALEQKIKTAVTKAKGSD